MWCGEGPIAHLNDLHMSGTAFAAGAPHWSGTSMMRARGHGPAGERYPVHGLQLAAIALDCPELA